MYWYDRFLAVTEEDGMGNLFWNFTEKYNESDYSSKELLSLLPNYDNFDYVVGNYYLLTVRFKPIGALGNRRGIYVYIGEANDPYIAVPSAPMFISGDPGRGRLRALPGGYYELAIFFKLEYRTEKPTWMDYLIHNRGAGILIGLADERGDTVYAGKVGSGVKISKISFVEYPNNTEVGPDGFPIILPTVGDSNVVPPHNYLKGTRLPASSVMGLNESTFSYTTRLLEPLNELYVDEYFPAKVYETPITVTKITAEEALTGNTVFLAVGDFFEHGIGIGDVQSGMNYTLSIYVRSPEATYDYTDKHTLNPPAELRITGRWDGVEDFYAIFNLVGDGEVLYTSKHSAGVTKVQPPMNALGHWYRCWLSAPIAEFSELFEIGSFSWGPATAQGSYIEVYCPQFEKGEHPGLPVTTGATNYLPDPRVKFTWDGNSWVSYPLDPYKGGDGRNRIPSKLAGGWNNERSIAQSPFYLEPINTTQLEITVKDQYYDGPEAGVTGAKAARWSPLELSESFIIRDLETTSGTRLKLTVDNASYILGLSSYVYLGVMYAKGSGAIQDQVNGVSGRVISAPGSKLYLDTAKNYNLPIIPTSDYSKSTGVLTRYISHSQSRLYLSERADEYNVPIEPFQTWIFSFYLYVPTGRINLAVYINSIRVCIELEEGPTIVEYLNLEDIYQESDFRANSWIRAYTTIDLSEEQARRARLSLLTNNAFSTSLPYFALWFDGFMLEKKVGLKNEPSPWTSELGPEAIEESEIKTDQIQKGDLPGGMTLGGGEILTVQEEGEAFDGESITYKYEYRVPPRVVYLLGGITYDPILSSSISYLVAEVDNNTPTGFTPVLKLSSKLIDSASKVELTTVTTDDSYQKYNTRPTHILTKAGSPEADSQSYLYKIELNIQNLQGKYYVEGLSLPIAGSVLLEFFYDKGLGWASLGTRLYTGRSAISELITTISSNVSFFIPGAGSGAKFGIAIQQDSGVGKTYKMPGSTIQGFAVEYYTASSGGSEVPATIAGGRGIPYFISGEKYVEGAYED